MHTDILRAIVGIEIFPVISLLLFVGVFAGVLAWAARADRDVLDRHAALPLDDRAGSRRDAPAGADARRAR